MAGRKFIAAIGATLLVSGKLWAGGPPPLPEFAVADRLMPADPMPERAIRWSHSDVTMTDVAYSTIPGFRPLHLDLYRPVGDVGLLPLIVFVHGGGYAHANPRAGAAFVNMPDVLKYVADRGYVVASIEYRFLGEASFPAPLDDLQAAIRFLRGNAARLGIDGTRVGTWGMSAGAHLAAMNAVNCAPETCVQGFAGWFGTYGLENLHEDARKVTFEPLLRCGDQGCAPEALEASSPIRYLDRSDPPVLLAHGEDDSNVLPMHSVHFAERARAAGVSVDLLLLPGIKHGFIGATEASTKDALRRALSATLDFFDRVLKSPPVSTDSLTAR